jgi:serine/threonine protein phosphatase 1
MESRLTKRRRQQREEVVMALNRRIDRFERNTKGRDLIVGDVHGAFTALAAALRAAAFDVERDRLFCVGDLVDRGPESEAACQWLTFPWFHPVRGNHEELAIQWADPACSIDLMTYKANGGAWNIRSPGPVQMERAAMFATLPLAIELETAKGDVVIVHADCPAPSWTETKAYLHRPGMEGELTADCCVWSRARTERAKPGSKPVDGTVSDVRAVVVGHTRVERLTARDNVLFIDTGGWLKGGHFTLLNAETLLPETQLAEVRA